MPLPLNIPSVGQPGTLVGWYPTTLYHCHCDPGGSLAIVVITGINNPSSCQKCGNEYLVTAITPTPMGMIPVINYRPKLKPKPGIM